MPLVSPTDIESLEERYWAELSTAAQQQERELLMGVLGARSLDRATVKQVVEWLLAREGRTSEINVRQLEDEVSDSDIQTVTEAALAVERLRTQIAVLTAIPGIDVTTATAILGFVSPESHVVVDPVVYNGEFGVSVDQVGVGEAVQLIRHMRAEYGDFADSLRTVDRALFVLHGGFES